MRELLPWLGDRKAREAWDEVFSRKVLGAVVLGGATGKFVEYVVALLVLLGLGADAPPVWETVGYLAAWAVAIPVGVFVFAYWHTIGEGAKETVEERTEAVVDTVEDTVSDGGEANE